MAAVAPALHLKPSARFIVLGNWFVLCGREELEAPGGNDDSQTWRWCWERTDWHSIVRPHLAVHRRLSSGLLALLAVWHNHRVFARGVHKGVSPLHLSGMLDAPTDWLVALGYPPAPSQILPAGTDGDELALAA